MSAGLGGAGGFTYSGTLTGMNSTLMQGLAWNSSLMSQGNSLFNQENAVMAAMMGSTGGILGQQYSSGGTGALGLGGGSGYYGAMGPMTGLLSELMTLLQQMMMQLEQGGGSGTGTNPPCNPQTGNGGTLSQQPNGGTVTYTTQGGYQIQIEPGNQVCITSPNGQQTLEEWGDPHENIDGQGAINGGESTWSQSNRVIQLPDGTTIELTAGANNTPIQGVNIFEGSEQVNVGYNNGNPYIQNVDYNPYQTSQNEQQLPTNNAAWLGYNSSGQFQLTPEQYIYGFNPMQTGTASPESFGSPSIYNTGSNFSIPNFSSESALTSQGGMEYGPELTSMNNTLMEGLAANGSLMGQVNTLSTQTDDLLAGMMGSTGGYYGEQYGAGALNLNSGISSAIPESISLPSISNFSIPDFSSESALTSQGGMEYGPELNSMNDNFMEGLSANGSLMNQFDTLSAQTDDLLAGMMGSTGGYYGEQYSAPPVSIGNNSAETQNLGNSSTGFFTSVQSFLTQAGGIQPGETNLV